MSKKRRKFKNKPVQVTKVEVTYGFSDVIETWFAVIESASPDLNGMVEGDSVDSLHSNVLEFLSFHGCRNMDRVKFLVDNTQTAVEYQASILMFFNKTGN